MTRWSGLTRLILIFHFDEAAKMSCIDANDEGKLLMQPGQSDEDGNADAKTDGPNDDGKMMPCPVAHVVLAKMRMPTAE